jgi:hypothetical protein
VAHLLVITVAQKFMINRLKYSLTFGCDVLRYEKKLEKEVFNNAIGRYVKDTIKNIRKLFEYAEIFNIKNKVQTYVGVWL